MIEIALLEIQSAEAGGAVAARAAAQEARDASAVATTKAGESSASASSAATSASTATAQASIATTEAGNAASSATASAGFASSASTSAQSASASATTAGQNAASAGSSKDAAAASATAAAVSASSASGSASTATTQALIATTQAGIATTKAGESASSATAAAASAATATSQATISTTKAGESASSVTAAAASAATATSQATIATTKASESASSAMAAAASSAAASDSATQSANSAAAAQAAKAGAESALASAVAVVTGGTGSLKASPGKLPLADANGRLDPTWWAAIQPNSLVNHIGVPGTAGFGVGICPSLPAGFTPLPGCTDPLSANYGNYQFSDGSVMVWIPAFYLRLGHANNPTYAAFGANSIDIQPLSAYPTEAEANSDGYYLHRAFVNAGANQLGFFRDKYDCSLNGNVASSIAGAMPMVSGPVSMAATAMEAGKTYTVLTVGTTDYTLVGGSNVVGARFTATGPGAGTGTVSQQVGFLGATANGQTPANAYYGAINAARSRGAKFFQETIFMADALCRLTAAHGQASTSATYCAWYDATGVKNFPKGNNNGALKDVDDTSVTFTSAGVSAYPAFALTGSGAPFAKTTHNGQACGITDVAGNIWKINPGMTCIAAAKTITGATQTNPVQLTIAAHGYTTGRLAMITGVVGMTQINDKVYKLTVIDANTVSLDGVDGTAFTSYTSGGSCTTGTFHLLKASVDVAALTSGATLATDHWGATGVAAQFDQVEVNFSTSHPSNGFVQRFGSGANAVFDWSTPAGRALAMAGMPAAGGVSVAGSNLMGLDYFYQYICDQLCVISRGNWGYGSSAGSRARYLAHSRASADLFVGFAASRYL